MPSCTRTRASALLAVLLFNQGCAALRPTASANRPPALNEKVRVVASDEPIRMYFLHTDSPSEPRVCAVTRVEGRFGEIQGDSLFLNEVTRIVQVRESDGACRPATSGLVLLSRAGGQRHVVERPTGGIRGPMIALAIGGAVAGFLIANAAKTRSNSGDCSTCR